MVLHLLASADRRGAEVFATALAGALVPRGLRARIVALAPATAGAGVPVDEVVADAFRPRGAARLRDLARGCDVVVGHGSRALPGGTVATLGRPVPFVYRSIGDPSAWGATTWPRRLRVGVQLRRASRTVALWPGAADTITAAFGVPAGRVEVIPNAAPVQALAPVDASRRAAARAALGLSPEALVVALVGALSEEKGVERGVAAARRAGAEVLVAGDGPRAAALRSRWGDDPAVRLLGVVGDVAPVLHASDVLLVTSRTEGQPGVVIEAGLAGVPQVVTAVGGLPSMVDDATGCVVPADAGEEEVAAALVRVAADGPARGARSQARMRARFSLDAVADAWAALLVEVAGR
ncbi:glycosyltransferase family 4 protein [Iamia majanohamensis]|uniref:Glycosyltransferase family 4 protein n=1 Tax=Iamia majanohamensis TaxID=467976 RepID=A0AAF0BVV7_9ACTN|nr:glycosyltransferase family 4 protein [Iamia majanohamensis]WCO69247.1 glycosyltransferase family 4 protein [Iamia majanohamensis]